MFDYLIKSNWRRTTSKDEFVRILSAHDVDATVEETREQLVRKFYTLLDQVQRDLHKFLEVLEGKISIVLRDRQHHLLHRSRLLREMLREMGRPACKLFRFVDESDELWATMIRNERAAPVPESNRAESIRMPVYKPHVVVSFAGHDLVGSPRDPRPDPSRAGAEAWAICDYIREALHWPMDFIYIDAEQAGLYDVDHYEYKPGPLYGRHILRGTDTDMPHIEELFEDIPEGKRNWKAQFEWARQNAEVMLLFLSSSWFCSTNCCRELADYIEAIKRGEEVPVLLIVTRDSKLSQGDLEGGALLTKQMQANAGMQALRDALGKQFFDSLEPEATIEMSEFCKKLMGRLRSLAVDVAMPKRMSEPEMKRKFSFVKNVFTLEPYFQWLRGRGFLKSHLQTAADQSQKLKDRLGELIGSLRDNLAEQKWYLMDAICGQRGEEQFGDDDHEGRATLIRNPYHGKFEKRYNINTVTREDIFPPEHRDGLIPQMGEGIWGKFEAWRAAKHKKGQQITDAYELLEIEGLAKTRVELYMPFFSFRPAESLQF